jgi:NADH:ubiquinone oxidoreductase subunit E
MDEFTRHFNIVAGETTPDGLFTIAEARCLGACGQAPVCMVNETVHAKVTPDSVANIIAHYTAEAQAELEEATA